MNKITNITNIGEYNDLLKSIKTQIKDARLKASFSVNRELILLYWNIGKQILDRQDKAGWGSKIIEQISKDIRTIFPEMKGFSPTSLKYMRIFASRVRHREIGPQAVDQLPWGHIRCLLDRFDNPQDLFWYTNKIVENGWSRNVLSLNIKTELHKREGKGISNFKKTLPEAESDLVNSIIKDPYNLEFLDIKGKFYERDLENKLIENIKKFLLELGTGFAFVGNQYHVELEGEDYYIDMLFYQVRLKRYFIIELKLGKFKPEYAGKLSFYINLVDKLVKDKNDNPTIGLLLCEERKNITAEYALETIKSPAQVSEFKIATSVPNEFKEYLPSPEQIKKELLKDREENTNPEN